MSTGVFLPPFDELADPVLVATLAAEAEVAGWDGIFLWDHIAYRAPVQAIADPWLTLAAMASATQQIRLGPMVTPLPRRRPVVVARETATLDLLSGGRLIFGVGIGGDKSREFSATGDEGDDRIRGRMLDEGLQILAEAWNGELVQHHGEHYVVDRLTFYPVPVQRPRPPVWVAARAGNPAPLRRAARWDGVFPIDLQVPDDLIGVVREVGRDPAAFDIVASGPPGADPVPWRAAGATWWLVALGITDCTVDRARGVIRDGPPD